jgi:MFS family permease
VVKSNIAVKLLRRIFMIKTSYHNVTVRHISVRLGWMICSLAALFYCYEFFLRVAPSVMMPALMSAYHAHAAEIGTLSAFYYFAYTPMQLVVGVLMDRYGPRRLLTLAILICALGSYLFVVSDHIVVAEIGRFLVGFGSAFAFVGVLKLASVWLPPERFALASGLATMLGMLGAICGDVLLTELVDGVGWRHSMYLSAGIGIFLAIAVWLVVRDSIPGKTRQDAHQFRDIKHALSAFVRVVKDGRVWISGIIGGLIFLPTTAFAALWGVHYMEEVYNFGSEQSGIAISMIFLGWAIGGPLAGWLSDKIKRRRLPLTIGSLVAAILIALVVYLPGFPPLLVYPVLFVFGLFSSVQVIVFALSCDYTVSKASGTVVAFTNMLVMFGGMVFQPFIGYMLDWAHGPVCATCEAVVYNTHDYRVALIVLPVGLIISLILTFFVKETHCKPLLHKAGC